MTAIASIFRCRTIQIDYRQTLFLREINFQVQTQNHAARRIDFDYRDRSVGMSAENLSLLKNLLTPLFLMGCFPVDFQEVKRPLRTKSVKRPIKVGKRPINEGKRPIKAMVLVGISVGCLIQNCLQWGRSNLVDPAESPKIRLLNRDLGDILSIFPGKTAKHRVH